MKHAWGITKSKKNIILKPKGEKEGVIRATLLLGKNNESKLTMVVAEEMSSFQAFCFAVSHLSYLEWTDNTVQVQPAVSSWSVY